MARDQLIAWGGRLRPWLSRAEERQVLSAMACWTLQLRDAAEALGTRLELAG